MSQTLYRKYRPHDFSEIIGQAPIIRTLTNSLKNGHIGQAYLFTGPRGTGKTSTARILAKTVNCKKPKKAISCDKCSACQLINTGKSLDIIEIDAASNTGVDNIRDLRDTIALAPSTLKYKVYIIDEVHMLSTGAFNALLKTLEEPPAHVIFILATTEISKVPDTIISRCQRFDFTRLPINHIIQKLALIAKKEKVTIDKEALNSIALAAEGGMRDAESLLGQIISLEDKTITLKEVEEILGTTNEKATAEIATFIMQKKSALAITKINTLIENGYDLQIFNKALINYLRQLMLLKIDPELKKYFSFELSTEQLNELVLLAQKTDLAQIINAINLFLEAQNKIAVAILPQLPLEIAIIKTTKIIPQTNTTPDNPTYTKKTPPVLASSVKKTEVTPKIPTKPTPKTNPSKNKPSTSTKNTSFIPKPISPSDQEIATTPSITLELATIIKKWPQLLIDIRPYNHSLSALLANCQAIAIKNNQVTLATPYEFYGERIKEAKNKLTIEKVLSKLLESNVYIIVIIDKKLTPQPKEIVSTAPEKNPSKQKNNLLNSALEMMGGKIVE